MISGRFVGVRVQQGGFISQTNFAFRRSDAKTKIYYRWKRAGLSIELSDGCWLAHRPSSINPLAAIPAKPNECQGSDRRQKSKSRSFLCSPRVRLAQPLTFIRLSGLSAARGHQQKLWTYR